MRKLKSSIHNQNWVYFKLLLFVSSIGIAIWIAQSPSAKHIVITGGILGYIEAFFAGILYTYTISAVIGAVLILLLARTLSPLRVALIASFGAVSSDYLIFNTSRFTMSALSHRFSFSIHGRAQNLRRNPYLQWLLIIFGLIVIATPLPDELGVGIIGATNVRSWQFIALSFFLQCAGMILLMHLIHI